jgi:uncharacterized protein (DUF302 family)
MEINIKTEMKGSLEEVITKVTNALQGEGFGVLTRVDLHAKIKEKLDKDILPAVILGSCNPKMAYEAYNANSDVAALLPCNAVVRELPSGSISIELTKPSALMEMLGDITLRELALGADEQLERVIQSLEQ